MKSYNGNLEEISLPEEEKYLTDLMSDQISFIEELIGKDSSELLKDRADGLAYVQFLSERDSTYQVIYNGEKHTLNARGAAAQNAMMEQSFDGDKWTLKNGLYLRGGVENNDKQRMSHELFHNLSQNNTMGFDENGIGYTKSGVEIVYYDRQDNEVDKSLDAKGLNEGITEMLAMQYSDADKPQAYDLQVGIAQMLNVEGDNTLLKAYFSENDRDFKEFLNDFESRQSSVTRQDLVSMDTSQRKDQSYIENMIRGCSEYSLSYCQTMEDLNTQKGKLYSILDGMIENPNIYTGKDNDREVFEATLNQLISKREQELGAKTQDSKEQDNIDNNLYHINDSLINQKVTIPNGRQISASQYIQEFVAPHIPESGTFKLKSGMEISAKQYIEEFVLGDGQTKYNGDIEALINDTVERDEIPPEKGTDGNEGPGVGMSQTQVTYTHEEEQVEKDADTKPDSFKDSLENAQRQAEPKSNSFINSLENTNTLSNSFIKSLSSKREEYQIGKSDVEDEMKAVANEQTLSKYRSLKFKSTLGPLSQEEQLRMEQLQQEQVVRDYMFQRQQRTNVDTITKPQGMYIGR